MGRSSASPSWMRRASSAKRAPTFSVLRSIARTCQDGGLQGRYFLGIGRTGGRFGLPLLGRGLRRVQVRDVQPRRRQALVIDADPQTGHVTRPRACCAS